jgi:hypothetical protein
MQIRKKKYCVLEICFGTLGMRLVLFLVVLLTNIERRTCKYFFLSGNSFEWHKMLLETRFWWQRYDT